MAIKTIYRIKNAKGQYETYHFQTSADQVITNDELQFVTAEEKELLRQPKNYTHQQLSAMDTWVIQHNLNRLPSVTITDSAGTVVVGDVKHIDLNTTEVSFTSGFAGTAYLI